MTVRLVAFFAALAVPLAAYELLVPDRQYRFCPPTLPHCPAQEVVDKLEMPKANTPDPGRMPLDALVDKDGYQLAFIEYRDSGKRWDNVELEAAKVMIETARKRSSPGTRDGGPVHLIMFFHGWANNADESPKKNRDVEKFQAYLKDYVLHLESNHAPVLGLYFAWHGRSLNLNHGLHTPSFWTRGAAARRVGLGADMQSDFHCLTELAIRRGRGDGPRPEGCESKTYPQGVEGSTEARTPRSRVIVLGHSFGARVLENVLLGSVPSSGDVEGTCKSLVNGIAVRPPVDLILFENAATGARLIWRQYLSCQPCGDHKTGCKDVGSKPFDFSKSVMVRPFAHEGRDFRAFCGEHPTSPECQPYPLLISISGKRDWLTRGLLAIAAAQHPAAFLPWLQTHRVDVLPKDQVSRSPDPSADEVVGFDVCKVNVALGTQCPEGQTESYMLKRKRVDEVVRTNAIWTMAVPKEIIGDHGDVWNPGYLNFQLNLIASHDPDEAAKQSTIQNGRVKLK